MGEKRGQVMGAADIGGTKIAAGILGADGSVLSQEQFPTGTDAGEAVCRIWDILKQQAGRIGAELKGIGLSCAGPVDRETGKVENPYTLPGWEGYPITEALSRESGLEVRLENDANCALLGEIHQKGLMDQRVLMLTIGTGIGGAFWDGRALYRTGGKYHPELGHLGLGTAGAKREDRAGVCYCGRGDCAEHLLSGTALHRRARARGYGSFTELAERQAEQEAQAFLKTLDLEFSSALWNYGLIFQPQALILGGGMAEGYFPLFESFKKHFDRRMEGKADFIPPFSLLRGEGKKNPALIGAALLFCETTPD